MIARDKPGGWNDKDNINTLTMMRLLIGDNWNKFSMMGDTIKMKLSAST